MAVADLQRVQPAKDHPGRFGYAATKFGNECISDVGRTRCHVPVGAFAEVVGTLQSEGVYSIELSREQFTDTQ